VIDLSTSYLGLSLPNPLVVAASPLSEDVARIQEMADIGAAAVVLQSLFEEQLTTESSVDTAGASVAGRYFLTWPATTPGPRVIWSTFGRPKPQSTSLSSRVSTRLRQVAG
jgi:hypothetical protein